MDEINQTITQGVDDLLELLQTYAEGDELIREAMRKING